MGVAGVDPDKHLDLQTLGWDKCTAAMEEAISCEKAEPIFQAAADKFQEVAATGGDNPDIFTCSCMLAHWSNRVSHGQCLSVHRAEHYAMAAIIIGFQRMMLAL